MRARVASAITAATRASLGANGAGDDARPVVGVGGEQVFLERVDLVADEAGDGQGNSLYVVMHRSLGDESWECVG